jgi:hypothetical protein
MIWSFSGHNQFKRCQRQWYYKNLVASALSKKDLARREAYILSTLQSIYAWRGSVTDDVITDFIIPKIANKNCPTIDETLAHAKKLCRVRYDFAMSKKYREEGMSKALAGDSYCALHPIEYGLTITNEDFKKAWMEIETSLTNFLGNQELLDYLKSAERLITQRALTFKVGEYTVRGVPDLIALFGDAPPHIFDWKVHVFATKMYQEQLLIYALALERGNRHNDFPADMNMQSAKDIRISEYQLLKNSLRDYSVNDEYLEDIDELISESILEMSLVGADKKFKDVDIQDFTTASYPETCQSCSFKKICWNEN